MIWQGSSFVFQLSPEPKGDGAAVIYRFRYTGKIYLITSVKLGRISVFDGDGCGGVGDRQSSIQIVLEGGYHSLQLLDTGRDRLLILLQAIENLVGIGLDVGTREAELAVSRDHATALQPGQQSAS